MSVEKSKQCTRTLRHVLCIMANDMEPFRELNPIVLMRYGLFRRDKITINRVFTLHVCHHLICMLDFSQRLLPFCVIPFSVMVSHVCAPLRWYWLFYTALLIRKRSGQRWCLRENERTIIWMCKTVDLFSSFNLKATFD